jgi:hypothetical protein
MLRKFLTAMFVAIATLWPTLTKAEIIELQCYDTDYPSTKTICQIDVSALVVLSRVGHSNRPITVSKDDNYYLWAARDNAFPDLANNYSLDRRTLELKGWVPGKGAAFSADWQCRKVKKQL